MIQKWIETEKMKRLTMDNVEEMDMFGLAHNCCYIDENGNTRYRDFEIDIDARELAKGMLKEMTEDAVSFESDEDFDDWMGCYIGEDGICTQRGLIATFYQNLWAMAELREKLKYYEDLEEQGRLLVLPCKVGEHPEETYLTQFLKHYPNAPLDDDGTPKVCVNELGFTRDDECTALNCINCWNTPIEEE